MRRYPLRRQPRPTTAARLALAAATAVLAASAAWAVVSVPGAPASAAHPCATDAPAEDPCRTNHGGPSPSPSRACDDCDVRLGLGDDGRVVAARTGDVVGVDLGDGSWDGPDADRPGLFRTAMSSSTSGTWAAFRAMRAGRVVLSANGDTSCQHADPACPVAPRTWTVTVDVSDPAATPSPGPTSSPEPCPHLAIDPAPGTLMLGESSSGTHTVERDRFVVVHVPNDCAGTVFRLPSSSGGLFRSSASEGRGDSFASFQPQRTGEFVLTGSWDAECSHLPEPCARTARVWQVTVRVIEPPACAVSVDAPLPVRLGTATTLAGWANPNDHLTVSLRRRDHRDSTESRFVTADGSGRWAVGVTVHDDHGVSARTTRCASAEQVLRVLPVIQGPARAGRGSQVTLVVTGPPGVPVQVLFRRAGGTAFVVRRWGTTGADGRYTTSYVADVDHRWYARTGPGTRTTAPGLTQVR